MFWIFVGRQTSGTWPSPRASPSNASWSRSLPPRFCRDDLWSAAAALGTGGSSGPTRSRVGPDAGTTAGHPGGSAGGHSTFAAPARGTIPESQLDGTRSTFTSSVIDPPPANDPSSASHSASASHPSVGADSSSASHSASRGQSALGADSSPASLSRGATYRLPAARPHRGSWQQSAASCIDGLPRAFS